MSDEEMVLGDASYASIVVMREKPKRFFRTLAQKGHRLRIDREVIPQAVHHVLSLIHISEPTRP